MSYYNRDNIFNYQPTIRGPVGQQGPIGPTGSTADIFDVNGNLNMNNRLIYGLTGITFSSDISSIFLNGDSLTQNLNIRFKSTNQDYVFNNFGRFDIRNINNNSFYYGGNANINNSVAGGNCITFGDNPGGNTLLPFQSGLEGKFMGLQMNTQNDGGFYQNGSIGVLDVFGGSNRTPNMVFNLRTGGQQFETMRISNLGNVGIANENPYERLTVNGNIVSQNGSQISSNLISNGDFSGGTTDWIIGSGWTLSSGSMRFDLGLTIENSSANGTNNSLEQPITNIIANEIYRVRFTITNMEQGFLQCNLGGGLARRVMNNGSYDIFIRTTTTQNLKFYPMYPYTNVTTGATRTFIGNIDNIQVNRVEGGNVVAYGLFTGGGPNGIKVNTLGNVAINSTTPTCIFDINGATMRIRNPSTIGATTSPGNTGDIVWNDDYIYVRVSNGWKRANLNSW
jgi:hypothetical protein